MDTTANGGGGFFWNRNNSYLKFGTNNAERGRFDASGNLLVGTTTSPSGSNNLSVQGGAIVVGGINTIGTGNATGQKNYLDNGNFDIWQAGRVASTTTGSNILPDRWQYINDGTNGKLS